jgi:hypothetical protein
MKTRAHPDTPVATPVEEALVNVGGDETAAGEDPHVDPAEVPF